MIQRVEFVGHGRPASARLADVVRAAKAAGRGPLSPVTVVVPSNFAGLAARRLLGSGALGPGGLANVQFLTPFRLAELLAADRLGDRRPLTNAVLASAVRRTLAEDAGPFGEVAGHLATEQALAALYGELSQVSPDVLDTLEVAGGGAALAVRQHRAIAARLVGFTHEDEIARTAASRPDLETALGPFGTVIWYLPEPMTPALGRLLEVVLRTAPSAVVVGLTGDPEADGPVLGACRRVGVPVPAEDELDAVASPRGSTIVSVSDADDEVRAVVRRVSQLAEDGVPLDRIGIFHPVSDPYVRSLHQQLAAAGIPANGPSQDRLAHSVAGRTLISALALPAERWRRDRVLALVSGAPVRSGRFPARPAAWETISRRAGVVQDLSDWRTKLAALIARLEGTAAEPDPEGRPGVGAAALRQRDDTVNLAAFVQGLAEAVGAIDRAPTWAGKSAASRSMLQHVLGSGTDRQRWPEDEQAAYDRVEDALARLATLDELEPDPTPEVFRRALGAELDVRRGRVGRYGNGVSYGPLPAAVGQDLDAVFVVGLAEGTCPTRRQDDALLPDSARALAEGQLPLRHETLHDQHRWLLAALAAAPEGQRYLLHPRGDLRGGRTRLPSRWLLPTASALAGKPVYSTDFGSLSEPVVEVVPSFAAGLRDAPVAGSRVEHELAAVARFAATGGDPAHHPVAATVGRGLEAQAARRSGSLTRWDGNLTGFDVPSPARGQVLSATRLERWAGCGFQYFLGDVLALGERDDPERVLELSALDRGSLVHEVLERFFLEVIERGVPDPDAPWSPADRARVRAIADEVCERYEQMGRTGRPLHWRLQREDLLVLLDDLLSADDRFRARHRARPERIELAFGFDDVAPVAVELEDGRRIRFRGRADRVDVDPDGHHYVLDYKTGKGDKYKELAQDPVMAGRMLQLGLYAEVAEQVLGARSAAGFYWMVNGACDDMFGYRWTEAHRQRFRDVVAAIVDGIEAGTFAANPGDFDLWRQKHENCRYCDFDRVCTVDRGEQASAKAGSVELRVRDRLLVPSPPIDQDVVS